MHRMMEQEQQQGHTPYFIPVGGSVPLGSLGYVDVYKRQPFDLVDLGICKLHFEIGMKQLLSLIHIYRPFERLAP